MGSCASPANLFALSFRPPWAWVDRPAVLTELYIEHGTVGFDRSRSHSQGRSVAHRPDRLAGENELAHVYPDLIHAGQEEIVAAPGIDDQESPERPERAREGDPAIGRRSDNSTRPCRN